MSGPLLRPAPAIVPGGVLASVSVGHGVHDASTGLEPAERELADNVSPLRRDAFVAGRIALRAAVRAVSPGMPDTPLLRTGRGAPLLPSGLTGSISHKRDRAVAIAAPHDGSHVGVDLEERPMTAASRKPDTGRALARRILTPRELDAMAGLDDGPHRERTLLFFALKEAIYKAIDPFVERYVRFTEVEIDVAGTRDELHGGAGDVRLLLPECERAPMLAQTVWWMEPEWIVAVAVARRA